MVAGVGVFVCFAYGFDPYRNAITITLSAFTKIENGPGREHYFLSYTYMAQRAEAIPFGVCVSLGLLHVCVCVCLCVPSLLRQVF